MKANLERYRWNNSLSQNKSMNLIETFPGNLFRLEPKNLFFFFLFGHKGSKNWLRDLFPLSHIIPKCDCTHVDKHPFFAPFFVHFLWHILCEQLGKNTLGYQQGIKVIWRMSWFQKFEWSVSFSPCSEINLQKKNLGKIPNKLLFKILKHSC